MSMITFQNIVLRLSAANPIELLDNGANPITVPTDTNGLIGWFTTVSLSLGVLIAVVLVAIGGYKMIGSKGDAKAIQDAQDQIQNAILGFVLILAAVAVIRIIIETLGLTGLIGFS